MAVIVLSALTMLWLLVVLYAAWTRSDMAYPATGFGMFSATSGQAIDWEVTAITGDGDDITITAGSLGLSDLQLKGWIVDHVSRWDGTPRQAAEEELAALATAWQKRHGDSLTHVEARREVRTNDVPQTVAEDSLVASWSRS